MYKNRGLKFLSLILIMGILGSIVSCAPAPETPATVIVTKEVEGEIVEKVITATPGPASATPAEPEEEEMIGPIRVTYSAIPQGAYLASLIAWPRLATRNILVEPRFVARTDLAVQAVINGDVELGVSPTNLIVESNLRGSDLVILATLMGNDWAIAAPTEYESFSDLEGERVAVHGPGSLAELYVQHLEKETNTDVEIVNIPGSAVRTEALLSGDIEASPIFLTDYLKLGMEAPGEFHVLVNLAKKFPENPVNVLYARRDWVENNQDVTCEIIAGILETHRKIAEDPDWAIAQYPAYLGQLERDLVEKLVPEYVDRGIWPLDGGLDEELARDMLDFLVETDAFGEDIDVVKSDLTVEDNFNLQPLNCALEKLD